MFDACTYIFNFYNKQTSSILVKILGQPAVSNQTILFILWPNCVTVSKLILLTALYANKSKRRGLEARNTALSGKPTDREDGRLKSQNIPLVGT